MARLRKRFEETREIDFFSAPEGEAAERSLENLETRVRQPMSRDPKSGSSQSREIRGGTWVTRRSIHVDRMASAWLIKGFIDPEASFKFVGSRYSPSGGEYRFDMFEAEFTHEGDRCTFEVLLDRFDLKDPALRAIGEIIHDIDLKDAKYARPEAAGIELLITGITMSQKKDEDRLERATAVLSDLHTYFGHKSASGRRSRKGKAK